MNKKEYILKVLAKVHGIREPAEEIIKEIEADNLTDSYIDYLYNQCVQAVKKTILEEQWDQQNILLNQIKSIKDLEKKQKMADDEDITSLDALINQI